MTTPEQITPGTFFIKDGSQRHIVKVVSVADGQVSFSWMGITFTKPVDDFCRYYTYITVPAMGNVR